MASARRPISATYTGTPVSIMEQMLADGYPAYSFDQSSDPYWNTSANNQNSAVGTWFNNCVSNSAHPGYTRPIFAAGFDGWIQANNWLIRTFSPPSSPLGHVTFGCQENPWAVTSGYWLHADLTNSQIHHLFDAAVELAADQCAQRHNDRRSRRGLRSQLFRVRPL